MWFSTVRSEIESSSRDLAVGQPSRHEERHLLLAGGEPFGRFICRWWLRLGRSEERGSILFLYFREGIPDGLLLCHCASFFPGNLEVRFVEPRAGGLQEGLKHSLVVGCLGKA